MIFRFIIPLKKSLLEKKICSNKYFPTIFVGYNYDTFFNHISTFNRQQ